MSLTKNKYTQETSFFESNSGEVITKPNQSMSIRDILFRNTSGMSYDNYKQPYYEEQASFSSTALNVIQDMEPTEKYKFLTEIQKKTTSLKRNIQEAIEQAEAAQKDAKDQLDQETE